MNAHQIINPTDSKTTDSVVPIDSGHARPSIPPPPLNRKRVGRYDILFPIAQGGMAEVYAGRLTGIAGFQRMVAIKTIHSHLSSQETFIRMFLDEARLAAGIHHPNVGEVIEVGEDNGIYYMVCELISGQSLKSFLRQVSNQTVSVSPAMFARIASATGFALQAAHDLLGPDGTPLNLVHRDISPRNILISYDGVVKLIDFGIAHAQGRISHTDTGTLKGKLGYMSPEQLRCDPLDRRSDVFSLGVVLYQMVTGRQAFHGKSDIERINLILANRYARPRKIVPKIPVELEGIIVRAMAYNPDERYPSAAAMSTALEDFILNTGERVNQFTLSRLMETLFSEEKSAHQFKIRGTRNSIGSTSSKDKNAVVIPGGRPTIPARPHALHTPQQNQTDPKKSFKVSSTKALAIAGIGAMTLGIAILILAFADATDTRDHGGVSSETMPDKGEKKSIGATEQPMPRPLLADDVRTTVSADKGAINAPLNAPLSDPSDEQTEITLAITPPDAQLALNGVTVAPNTKSLHLSKGDGPYRLQVFSEGYLPHEEEIVADEDATVSVSLRPSPTIRKHPAVYKKQGKGKKKSHGTGTSAVKTDRSSKKKSVSLAGSPYL